MFSLVGARLAVPELDPNSGQNLVGTWYSKTPLSPSSSLIRGYLQNPSTTPAIQIGNTVNLDNDSWSGCVSVIQSSYIGKPLWCPVVDTVIYNQPIAVTGFTAFKITGINNSGQRWIKGIALKMAELPSGSGTPGGPPYGLLTPPRLAQ